MLQLTGVTVIHNPGTPTEVVALNDVELTVPSGQFVTIVGSNGAGKSTLIQTVSGALRPTRGQVRINGRDVTRVPDHRRARYVARVFDNPHAGTVPDMTVEDNLALAFSRGHRRTLRLARTAARRAIMRDRLAVLGLGLEDRLAQPVATLSAGQRQSLTMIMATLQDPDVLLLDEHLAALDPATAARVLTLTTELVASLGCTTLMVTHNMDHALDVGNRLLVMSRGRVIVDLDETAKRRATITQLVDALSAAGDVVADRTLLEAAG